MGSFHLDNTHLWRADSTCSLKPQPFQFEIYRVSKLLQLDLMNDRINDCFEILVIIAHVSLDIH